MPQCHSHPFICNIIKEHSFESIEEHLHAKQGSSIIAIHNSEETNVIPQSYDSAITAMKPGLTVVVNIL